MFYTGLLKNVSKNATLMEIKYDLKYYCFICRSVIQFDDAEMYITQLFLITHLDLSNEFSVNKLLWRKNDKLYFYCRIIQMKMCGTEFFNNKIFFLVILILRFSNESRQEYIKRKYSTNIYAYLYRLIIRRLKIYYFSIFRKSEALFSNQYQKGQA